MQSSSNEIILNESFDQFLTIAAWAFEVLCEPGLHVFRIRLVLVDDRIAAHALRGSVSFYACCLLAKLKTRPRPVKVTLAARLTNVLGLSAN